MMSIRLRFTLLYTLILALTLTVFGFALYTIQAQDTLRSLKSDLSLGAAKLADASLRTDSHTSPPKDGPPHPPITFDEFSSEQEFQSFPEREIGRILDPNGNLVSSPFGREEDALPLSAEGLQTVQNKQDWYETATVSGEETLIYSRPVIVDGEVVYIVQAARPLTERNRTLQSLATTLTIASVIVTLIAFGIGWILSGITLQPIQRITHTAQKIGDERDFTRRVDYTGPPDEVGQLASTFNSMLSRLQNAFQKVEHSLQMQRDFVADVSHELRTPLTTLRGNLGLLRRTPPPEEQTDILNDMVDESDRLIRLVNDLLLLARADAGRSLAKESVDVSALLEETVRQARLLDSQRGISLNAAPSLKVMGDRDAVKQVLLIALDNALKHSSGDVNVTAAQNGSQVEIRVQDFGEGISPEKLEHIFDRFYRGEEDSAIPGFGLGLSIAKTLVENMSGEIAMKSEVGKGSAVIVNFHSAIG
ncbi:MAG: sensor histidine kinase [Anaerolineae bacterium]|nr:MAG: sensor histidine kinase [Anaerolineae bacterium]WKZ44396.1 MAG: HAMP domain-containing sensor histidine kinase [Anaerolineales bacterium]